MIVRRFLTTCMVLGGLATIAVAQQPDRQDDKSQSMDLAKAQKQIHDHVQKCLSEKARTQNVRTTENKLLITLIEAKGIVAGMPATDTGANKSGAGRNPREGGDVQGGQNRPGTSQSKEKETVGVILLTGDLATGISTPRAGVGVDRERPGVNREHPGSDATSSDKEKVYKVCTSRSMVELVDESGRVVRSMKLLSGDSKNRSATDASGRPGAGGRPGTERERDPTLGKPQAEWKSGSKTAEQWPIVYASIVEGLRGSGF